MTQTHYGEVTLRTGKRVFDRATLVNRAQQVASGLQRLGLSPEDSVIGLLRNDVVFFDLLEGSTLAGVRYTPINWHLTANEVAYIIKDSDARVVVAHEDLIAPVAAAIPEDVLVLVVETPPESPIRVSPAMTPPKPTT